MERRFREPKKLSFKKRVLILCEGETEVKYLRSLKSDERLRKRLVSVSIEIERPDNTPYGLVEKAIKKILVANAERNKYDSVWVVFDKDQHADIPEAYSIADKRKIKIAFSNICFEYWILLHFVPELRFESNCDNMIDRVKEHYPDYKKSDSHYTKLKDKISNAIENGKWVVKQTKDELERGVKVYELSAYTNVHELVEYLLTL